MKRILLILTLMAMTTTLCHAKTAQKKQGIKMEPATWFCGMKNPSLQLMLHGDGIHDAEVTTDYAGLKIDSLVRLDSPNYLFVYLNIADAQPGNARLTITMGKKKQQLTLPLMQRSMSGEEHRGFTNADVLYMLMPDRFAKGKAPLSPPKGREALKNTSTLGRQGGALGSSTRFPYTVNREEPSLRHGGNLEGIRQHLDYFCELGVTALWFTPVLENDMPESDKNSCYHGYATTDYYRVDPRFGTNAEYKQLIDEAHQKGLKVVMDMIFNHCGSEHPWMHDAPSKDWFNNPNYGLQTSYKLTPTVDPYASDVDLVETVDGWFVRSMPDLNQRNPHLMTYLIQNSIWWIETVGIDGIRMDTYPYADAVGMARWMNTLNDEYPNFNVVGESWVTEPAFTAALQRGSGFNQNVLTDGKVAQAFSNNDKGGSNLNTVMDFAFFDRINQAKDEDTDDWWKGLNRIYNVLCYDYLYANPKSVMAFLDNHDTDRFLGTGKDTLALKQALTLLLTINRIPQLYYGTEILMNGTKAITDGHVREDFPGGFEGDKRNAFTAEGRTQAENAIFQWLSKLLHWRQGNRTITDGRQKQFVPYDGIYVMDHELDGKHVLVVLNGTKEQKDFKWERYREAIPDNTMATDVTSGRRYSLNRDMKLRPRQSLILEY